MPVGVEQNSAAAPNGKQVTEQTGAEDEAVSRRASRWRRAGARSETSQIPRAQSSRGLHAHHALAPAVAHRNYQAASQPQLAQQRRRQRRGPRRDQYSIERRPGRQAQRAVAAVQPRPAGAQCRQQQPGAGKQHFVELDAFDVRRELQQHRALVARAGAHFQHAVRRLHVQQLRLERHRVGLRNGLALADGEGFVLVGVGLKGRREEQVARHGRQGRQHPLVADTALAQLAGQGAALALVSVRVRKQCDEDEKKGW